MKINTRGVTISILDNGISTNKGGLEMSVLFEDGYFVARVGGNEVTRNKSLKGIFEEILEKTGTSLSSIFGIHS